MKESGPRINTEYAPESKEEKLSPEEYVNLSENILREEEEKLTKKLQIIESLKKINMTVAAGIGLIILAKIFMGENEANQLLPFIGGTVALGSFSKIFDHLSPGIVKKINQVHEKIEKIRTNSSE